MFHSSKDFLCKDYRPTALIVDIATIIWSLSGHMIEKESVWVKVTLC